MHAFHKNVGIERKGAKAKIGAYHGNVEGRPISALIDHRAARVFYYNATLREGDGVATEAITCCRGEGVHGVLC